ncbi:MAG: hypothetical protein DI637_04870 [Citromicrobium sp.]|nr:MAG: hypothetical protein DI637_04870 [Citromicrobium sp.]
MVVASTWVDAAILVALYIVAAFFSGAMFVRLFPRLSVSKTMRKRPPLILIWPLLLLFEIIKVIARVFQFLFGALGRLFEWLSGHKLYRRTGYAAAYTRQSSGSRASRKADGKLERSPDRFSEPETHNA